ncbi:MAG: UTP--glucose-1-phosphate uridylyltransferase, partial [Moorea sp. SIO2B7]|nr:UTP--glucose-1-phosphate uridylyltransferase [Moorena sp. SIO2B7]
RDGRAKPIIMIIVEEAINAGIEEIGIIVQREDQPLFEDFFKTPLKPELYQKLSPQNQEYSQYIQNLGKQISFIIQDEQEGYGHAVFCGKEWVKGEPFLLFLGDHVYVSDIETSCTKQLLDIYEKVDKSVIGLTIMPGEIIHKAGCVTGMWQDSDSIFSLTKLYEKPTLEYAKTNLHTEGMAENQFLAVFGIYILEAKIFDYLEEDIKNNSRYKGEFHLTTCLERLRQDQGMMGYLIKGQDFDTGMPQFYRQTMIEFPNANYPKQ